MGQQLVALLPRLRRFAMVLARSRDAADDLVQSALERALSRADQWEPGTQLDRWMFRIVKTVWLNGLRSAQIRRTEPIEDHIDSAVVDGARTAEARISLAEVKEAFDRLPVEQQEPLLLVCVEGYTYAEAAAFLGIPMGTVISRLVRGRATLMASAAAEDTSNVTLFRQKRSPT
jgi:RNA polymerase sigma-70 factor, ECF subfamily